MKLLPRATSSVRQTNGRLPHPSGVTFARAAMLGASLLLSGCDLIGLQAQASSVCQHLSKQSIQVPPGIRERWASMPPDSKVALDKTFDFAVNVQLPAELRSADPTLTLQSVTVTAADAVTRFDFLDAASITLLSSDAAVAPVTIDWKRDPAQVTQVQWNGQGFEIGPFLKAGSLTYQMSMVGSLPATDLLVDVDACASASVTFKLP
jgi:hypothetical protein